MMEMERRRIEGDDGVKEESSEHWAVDASPLAHESTGRPGRSVALDTLRPAQITWFSRGLSGQLAQGGPGRLRLHAPSYNFRPPAPPKRYRLDCIFFCLDSPSPQRTLSSHPANMPRSKRSKVTTLSKTPIRTTKASKAALVTQIRDAIDQYEHLWVFSVGDMRNEGLKQVRAQWRGSGRFFFGKGKVMAKALGETPETEHQEGLHKLASVSRVKHRELRRGGRLN